MSNNAYSSNQQSKAVVHADPVFESDHGFHGSSASEEEDANSVSVPVVHQTERSVFENATNFIGNGCNTERPMCGQRESDCSHIPDSAHYAVPESPIAPQFLPAASDAPRSPSIEEGDHPFSQELADMQGTSGSDDESTASDIRVSQEELVNLQNPSSITVQRDCSAVNAAENVIEDYCSGIFTGEDGDSLQDHGYTVDYEDSVPVPANQPVSNDAEDARSSAQRRSGLPGWDYLSAFARVEIVVDNVDESLAPLFINEANAVLKNACEEIQGANYDAHLRRLGDVEGFLPTRLELFKALLPNSVLEKVREAINRVLVSRSKRTIELGELMAVIAQHILCSSYGESVTTVSSRENCTFFFQMAVDADRYKEVWSALSCTKQKRARVEHTTTGWANKPSRGNALITEMEQECAAVNRRLLYVPGATIFSLDDDHLRLSSRAVTQYTNLQQLNNPSKALGPVSNALCSALNPWILACHYSRPREKLVDVWERLVRLVQGAPTRGAIAPMADAIFAADRGYNVKETISFINETLGATGLGTHKRSLDFPYVFGNGPIAKRHKGMPV